LGVRTTDKIFLTLYNQEFYLGNETYEFYLKPHKQVPKNIKKHTIFTASTGSVTKMLNNSLNQGNRKRTLNKISPEEYEIISYYLDQSLPHLFEHVDSRKRGVSLNEIGRGKIKISDDTWLTYTPVYTKKRAIGTQFCVHIPFVTQCDNTPSLDAVKAALSAHINLTRKEVDDIRAVSDARGKQLEETLTKQNSYITSLTTTLANATKTAEILTNIVKIQSAQMTHGDYVLAAQVKHTQYLTNYLVKYASALGSADPRAVVAQPALAELFTGFVDTINLNGDKVITGQTPIDFLTVLLPQSGVRNVKTPDYFNSAQNGYYVGVNLVYNGNNYPVVGPVRLDHPLIFSVGADMNFSLAFGQTVTKFGGDDSKLRCVSLFGYNVLMGTDPSTFNNVVNFPKQVQDISLCNAYKYNSSGVTLYRFLSLNEGVVTPFYSNCNLLNLKGFYENLNIIYMSQYPNFTTDPSYTSYSVIDEFTGIPTEMHYISSNCYINILPDMLGMTYHYDLATNVNNIAGIRSGFRTNLFTINPDGELSSSIQFVSTSDWLNVYKSERISQNNVITTEIQLLSNVEVLFNISTSYVIDASDSFYGPGNNGRDCIEKYTTTVDYDENIVDCFFQNDELSYFATDYLKGEIRSTGMARYVNKFNFALGYYDNNDKSKGYKVTLKPKEDTDFDFFIDLSGSICPELEKLIPSGPGCYVESSFYQNINKDIKLYRASNSVLYKSFTNYAANPNITFFIDEGKYLLEMNGNQCYYLNCINDNKVTYVEVTTPNFEIVTKDDLSAIVGSMDLYYDLNYTLHGVDEINKQLQDSRNRLNEIALNLSKLNFSVTDDNLFGNFSELRAKLDFLLGIMNAKDNSTENADGSAKCQSTFGSVQCFFERFASSIIICVIVTALLIVGLFVMKKTGALKKIKKRIHKKKSHKKAKYDEE